MTAREYARRAYRFLLPLLYGSSRYKLFLKTSLGEIDLRLQQITNVTDYFSTVLRPIRIQAPFGSSMLVLAPHQDDETIGCGGAIALQRKAGRPVSIVLLTDGGDEHASAGMTRAAMAELRNEESRRSASVLGAAPPEFLGYADLRASRREAASRVSEILARTKADAVFTPFPLDGHPEHRLTNVILADALAESGRKPRILGYEVWSFAIPNVVLVIDDVMDAKVKALDCFEFANRALNYTWSTQGVNMYRCRLLEAGAGRYAESFFEIPAEEFIPLVRKIEAAEVRAGERTEAVPL